MPTQRCGRPDDQVRTDGGGRTDGATATRRGFLAAAGAGVTGVGALGGCVGTVSLLGGGSAVSVLAAGSLQSALSDGLEAAVAPEVQVEAHGSVTVARLVASGRRDPDVVALADTALFAAPLSTPWHAAFATNALVVAYDSGSAGGRAVGSAERWFDPVLAGEASLGRTDPDLDPLGYRTLFALALATDVYDESALGDRLLSRDQIYPETTLLGRFETGAVDAAVVYRSMAEDRGYDYVALPPALDLSDPDRADAYATASYELSDGTRVRGAPIVYGAMARRDADAVREVFGTLVGGDYLLDHGFAVPGGYPTYSGEVPRGFRE